MSEVFGNEESGFVANFGAERSNIFDYEDAINKPSINSHELIGDQSAADLGLATPSDIPTNTSDLYNDSGYITNVVNDLANYYLKSETYTQAEVNSLIGAITTMDIRVVQELPTEDISTTTIYLVPSASAGTGNVYDEYIYVNQNWEMIGTTAVDLSDYYTKSEVNSLLSGKANSSDVYTKAQIDTMLIMDISNTIFGGE